MTKSSDLKIIIVTFNSEFWLKKTLIELQKQYLDKTQTDVSVVVVDNNSTDDTLSMVKREFRWVEVISMPENRGFAVANNQALKQANSDYVMLLNSDVECTPESNFDELLNYMKVHKKVGVITPKIEFTDGRIDPACHRGEPTLWATFAYFSRLEQMFPSSKLFSQYHQWYKDLNTTHQIDACSGAAMIVRTSAMKKVGLLDERFFMYAEDLDWCKRFREEGYAVMYYPEVKVIHHKYKSGIKSSSKVLARKTREHFYSTMLQYYDKHYRDHYPQFVRSIVKAVVTVKKQY